ncbi:MAG: hypothetical protein LRY73_10220 [Bacillus sp. (in: Bacteria)]|nr:hypothetical protein [Bacillus sp. (in: firmicutes)]
MAERVLEGYDAVHNKNFGRGKQLLEPIAPLIHQEERPNLTFLCYLAMAQIGSQDIEQFLTTFEEIQKYDPKNSKEKALKDRVEEMFTEVVNTLGEAGSKDE